MPQPQNICIKGLVFPLKVCILKFFMCLAQIISYSDLYCQFIIINPTFQQVCEQFQILAGWLTSKRQLQSGLALCICKLSGCRAEDRCAVNIADYIVLFYLKYAIDFSLCFAAFYYILWQILHKITKIDYIWLLL